MRQYFTFRPIVLNAIYTPQYAFDKELNTIDWLKYQFVCQNNIDNRQLAYFEYTGDIPTNTILEIVWETLAKYSYHPKTVEKAKEFIIYCFWDSIKNIEIVEDKIKFEIKQIEI